MQGIVLEEREGLIGGASGRDLETMFQMAYLHFTAPRADETAFQAHRGRMEAALANRSASPEAAFGDTLNVTLSQHHARRVPFTPDMVQALELDQAARFYRERFSNAGDFTFFLVGSFNPDSVRALVETWIGGLPSSASREQPRDLGIRPPEGVIERVVRRGVEPRARTQIIFTGRFPQSRENRHVLRSLGEALQIRLREVIREDLGGTYGVGVSASSRVFPDTSYTITVGFGSAPERLEELVEAVWTEIRAFQEAGPADEVIDRVKEMQRRGHETSMRQNPYWMGQLVASHQWGLDPRNILTAPELFDALTPGAVRDAARAYLRSGHYVRVSLMPEGATP
jgi:zinc protease